MRVRFIHSAAVVLSVLAFGVSACEKKEETVADKDEEAEPEPKKAEPEPEPTTTLTAEPAAPGITPRVKAELDNREDGATGSTLSTSGAKATMKLPTEWTNSKTGDFQVAKSKDGKAMLATSGDTTKLKEAATAIGLSECTWGATETIVVGKDKLQASAADGTCKKNGAVVPAVQVTIPDNSLLAVGAWETGGDDKGLFDTLRSITKTAGGTGDPTGIAACCAALQQNAVSAPPHQKGAYIAAAGACNALRSNAQARAGLAQVRALLLGANVPASCR